MPNTIEEPEQERLIGPNVLKFPYELEGPIGII